VLWKVVPFNPRKATGPAITSWLRVLSADPPATTGMDPDMEHYRVDSLPYGLYYIAEFLSPEEQQSLLDKVKKKNLSSNWTNWNRSQPNDGQSCLIADFSHTRLLLQRVMLSLMRRYPTGYDTFVWLK